jgi:hypothetical protein
MRRELFYCLAISLLLFGCATSPLTQSKSTPKPIDLGPEGSEPISFAKVIVRIPAGAQVGNEFPAKGAKGAKPFYWKTNLFFSDDELRLTAADELERYGYTVSGADQVPIRCCSERLSEAGHGSCSAGSSPN